MSLIEGPKTILPKVPEKASPVGAVANSLSSAGMRMLEKATGVRLDPIPAYLFYVDISGVVVAMFTECSGIGATREVETIVEGGLNDHAHMLPGKVQYNQITFSRGVSASQELWKWFGKGKNDFKVKRVNLSITQGAPGMNLAEVAGVSQNGYGVVKTWNVERAFPVSWTLSPLSVNNTTSTAIETLVIAHEGISLSPIFGTPMNAAGSIG